MFHYAPTSSFIGPRLPCPWNQSKSVNKAMVYHGFLRQQMPHMHKNLWVNMNPILGDINLPLKDHPKYVKISSPTPESDREWSKASGFQVASQSLRVQGLLPPGFPPDQETSWMMLDTISMAVPKRDTPTFGGSWKDTKTTFSADRQIAPNECHEILYNIIMRICMIYMFHLILNDNWRNPLYIILEYMLFVLFERIPCNMNMDPYCRDHSGIPTYTSNQPIYVLLAFFFPYSNVVQPLLRSSFGIKPTCRRLWGLLWNCCYWWIYATWLLL